MKVRNRFFLRFFPFFSGKIMASAIVPRRAFSRILSFSA